HGARRVRGAGDVPGDGAADDVVPVDGGDAGAARVDADRARVRGVGGRGGAGDAGHAAARLWVPRVHVRGAGDGGRGGAPADVCGQRHAGRGALCAAAERRARGGDEHPGDRALGGDGVCQRAARGAARDRRVRRRRVRVRDGLVRLRAGAGARAAGGGGAQAGARRRAGDPARQRRPDRGGAAGPARGGPRVRVDGQREGLQGAQGRGRHPGRRRDAGHAGRHAGRRHGRRVLGRVRGVRHGRRAAAEAQPRHAGHGRQAQRHHVCRRLGARRHEVPQARLGQDVAARPLRRARRRRAGRRARGVPRRPRAAGRRRPAADR
ncbi:hypothetical protein IWW51_006764, partial [Coemansia sp. RSA 2702]